MNSKALPKKFKCNGVIGNYQYRCYGRLVYDGDTVIDAVIQHFELYNSSGKPAVYTSAHFKRAVADVVSKYQ